MDFTDTRSESATVYSNLGRQASALLDIPSSPSAREQANQSRQNLRAAKSFADLRSYTPSPVPSSASFPAALGNNVSRYQQEYGGTHSVSSTTPSLTPTATGNNNESLLVNGLAGVSLTSPLGGGSLVTGGGGSLRGDPRDPRGLLSHERERGGEGTVGSGSISGVVTRSFSMGFDDIRAERDRGHVIPQRQPRGPDSDRGAGFSGRSRQHHSARGGGSGGELDVQSGVEIVVE